MKLVTLFFLFITVQAGAQHVECSSKEISVSGAVKLPFSISLQSFDEHKTIELAPVTITNHKGEVKRTITGLRGILLKDLLQKAEPNNESPKTFSEYYYVFTACDGYKVLYSWNEIFNSPTGNNIFLVKEKDGQNISSVTISDMMTGRRYIQGLSNIIVKRVE